MKKEAQSRFGKWLHGVKLRITNKAAKSFNSLSKTAQIISLVAFVLSSVVFYAYQIIVRPGVGISGAGTIAKLKSKPTQQSLITDSTGLNDITAYRLYLDSLSRAPTDRAELERIQKFRPGLRDSLEMMENYYQSHIKQSKK